MAKDQFTKKWITENSIEIVNTYAKGVLTLRGLHYRLVGIGMTNSIEHYKRVVKSIIDARWNNLISFDAFSDHDREMIGKTKFEVTDVNSEIEGAKESIQGWMNYYRKNRWENQVYYPEVFIEKKALQGVFEIPCRRFDVTLGACKGYPSLTFLNDASLRFIHATNEGKKPIILYFGDYDPSGEDIPRSIAENLSKLGCTVEVRRISLLKNQVLDWNLPPAPIKEGDSRSASWNGLGQVELDAVMPDKLQQLCRDAISSIFDDKMYHGLKEIEEKESVVYRAELKRFVNEDLRD